MVRNGILLLSVEQPDWVRHVDCSCRRASEAPAGKDHWSKELPLGSDEMEEAAAAFHLEGVDQDPVVD